MKRLLHHPAFWITLVGVLLGATFWALRARGPVVATLRARRANIEQHIVASGRVRVAMREQVAAQGAGRVVAVEVVAGQRVQAGDLLVALDDSEAQAALAEALAEVEQASARAQRLRQVGAVVTTQDLRQTRSRLTEARAWLARMEPLAQAEVVSPVELEAARQAVTLAAAQRTSAEALQLSSAALGADARILRTALLGAQARLEAAQVRLTHTRVVATHAGTVLSRSVEPGEVVQPAQTLLIIAAGQNVHQAIVQLDERNLPLVRLDQAARVSADAWPEQVFDATVAYIAPALDPERGRFEVWLDLIDPPDVLRPDLTVSVDLTVATRQDVWTLPSEVVHGASSTRPWLLTVDDGHLVRHDVTLGLRGEGSLEVIAGKGDFDGTWQVVVPDSQILVAGQRVRSEPR